VARGRILAFSIDLLRRLYNTLALPCECVMESENKFTVVLTLRETLESVILLFKTTETI